MPVERQVVVIYAVTNGYLDNVPVERVGAWERGYLAFLAAEHADILDSIAQEKVLSDEIEARLKSVLTDFNARFEES
jgi:F-type H+-transporting ATPase subunit alpha